MTLIQTRADYYAFLGLLNENQGVSPYAQYRQSLKSFSPQSVSEEDRDLLYGEYGYELVRPMKQGPGGWDARIAPISKSALVHRLKDFVINHANDFNLEDIQDFIQRLLLAAKDAEIAVIQPNADRMPDPRFRTCFAVMAAVASLAFAYASHPDLGLPVANVAAVSLLQAGIANFARVAVDDGLNVKMETPDTSVIAYGYLRALVGLLLTPGTMKHVWTAMSYCAATDVEALGYIETVKFCAWHHVQTAKLTPDIAALFSAIEEPSDCDRFKTTLILVDGLKTCRPETQDVKYVPALLSSILKSPTATTIARALMHFAESRVQSEAASFHAAMHGNHLSGAGEIVVSAMRRTINQGPGTGGISPYGPKYTL